MNNIFVYGSLRYGHFNHDLLTGCKFVGPGLARSCVLFNFGNYPGLVPARILSHSNSARGEIYNVSDEHLPVLLQRLDKLENEGRMYLRAKIQVELLESANKLIECITYLYMPFLNTDVKFIRGGLWRK